MTSVLTALVLAASFDPAHPLATLPARLSPQIALAVNLSADPATRALTGDSVTAEGLKLHLRFDGAVVVPKGCEVLRSPDGVPAIVGPIADAFCRYDALEALARTPGLQRAEPTLGHRPLPPLLPPSTLLDKNGVTPSYTRSWPQLGTGKGVTVADMDVGFNPFHPLHFRADGGRFRWLDVNGSGTFEPGTDAVDFNRNGQADTGETVGMFEPIFLSEYTRDSFTSPAGFDPGVDWLYLDENGNGARDFGAQFGDSKPTFGEQVFVADDTDGDGKLGVGEQVVALKTPRVKAIKTDSHVYRRGVDLSQYPVTAEQHASMVIGTLAGGDARLTRYHGVAPDAEVVLAENDSSSLVMNAAWAKSEGAQVMLWEMANWYLEWLDGSSAHEAACDALSAEGILQLGAAGNLGSSGKHFRQSVGAAGVATLPVTVPAQTPPYLIATVLWRGPSPITLSATWGTSTLQLTAPGGRTSLGTAMAQWSFDTSPRGTQKIDVVISLSGGRPSGELSFNVSNPGAAGQLFGYLEDPYSGWGRGVAWNVAGVTDQGTYGTPAVGDKTLAVGTYQVDWPLPGAPSGQLTYWSGRGPRLDGADTIDFVTPEDLFTAPYERTDHSGQAPPPGSYFVGAGTSNALPFATGIAVLLKEAHPSFTAAQLTQALHDGSGADGFTGTLPNDQWGHGKLNAFRAITGADAPAPGPKPVAAGIAGRTNGALTLDARASTNATRYRWDIGDDGSFEVDSTADRMTVLSAAPAGDYARLEVGDANGVTAAKVVPITELIISPAIDASMLGDAAPTGCGCDAGGGLWGLLAGVLLFRRRAAPTLHRNGQC